jgi:hypothetical protein
VDKILFQDDFLYDNESLENTYNFILKIKIFLGWLQIFKHTEDGLNLYRNIYLNGIIIIIQIGCPSM